MASDRQCSQLVAQAVIHLMMGVPLDSPLGMPTTMRRRQALAGPAAAPRMQLSCGLEEHSEAHASVFEAVACTLAHQRRRAAETAAEATTAALQGLSVDSDRSGAAAEAEVHGIAPGSPPAIEAPTPTAAAASSAAPAAVPAARVRHIGLGKRVSSRRTLFDTASKASTSSSSEEDLSVASKSAAAAAPAMAPAGLQPAAPAVACDGGRMLGSVALEMVMSPNHASTRALEAAAAAAAAPLAPATWAGRKRLRFD